ncbi:MAG TPA: hypothetical protein VNU71_13545 [Burkholderiaceae bacterium]|nr:hypothetical protein [Burkholderiaceae bacterium]
MTALTGGPAGGDNLVGFNGADYMVQDRWFQSLRPDGGEQLRYTLFADSGALPAASGLTSGNLAWGGDYGGWACDGANKGLKFNPIASRSKKTLICAMYSGSAGFTINAHFQDGSAPDATLSFSGDANHWWKAEWIGKQENTLLDFEIRSQGAGFCRVMYMYIGVPVKPHRPIGGRS